MLPSRGGAGNQRGTPSGRKPRGSLGRGAFGKRNAAATPAGPKTEAAGSKGSGDAPNGPKSSAPFTKGSGGPGKNNNGFRANANTFIPKSTSNLKHDDYNGRYASLKNSREQERKQAIADGFLADPDHPRSLANAITPVGTCQDMCAEFERVERVVQQDVWASEKTADKSGPDEARMVKKFRRAAAGLEEQLPSDLRPPPVLKRTIDFLFNNVLRNATTLASVHYFIWDRTRAVRNDFSIQQVSKPEDLEIAIDCYERIARFHIMSLHQLSGPDKPYDNYDAQQEREQLDKTLLSILQYYDDNRNKIPLPNEAEFRSYSIIFQIQTLNPDLEDRMQTWPKELLTNVRIERAHKLYTLVCNAADPQGPFRRWSVAHPIAQSNWAGFWAMIKSGQISYLMGCVAEIYFPYVRTMALNAILKAYKHGGKDKTGKPVANEDWSLEEIGDVLGLEDEQAIEDLLAQVGLDVGTRADGLQYFDINTASGRSPLAPVLPRSEIIERKRFRRSLTAVVNGMSVRTAHEAGLVEPEDDEDEYSLFVPERSVKSTVPTAAATGFNTGTIQQNQNPFGIPQPAINPFSNRASNADNNQQNPFGFPQTSGFSTNSPFGTPDGGLKKVHFAEDTKPESPFANAFPSQSQSSTLGTTPSFSSINQSQTPNPFAQTSSPFTQTLNPNPQQSSADGDSAKAQTADTAAQEEREAEQKAAKEREAQEKAARAAEEAREVAAREQEARELAAREQEARLRAAKEKALQEKIARERAAQERARQEAEARRVAERHRLEQEKIAKERQQAEQKALDFVSEQLAFGDGGLFDQFVEFRLGPMIKQAIAQVEQEERTREADWFRNTVLRHRYGRLWREVCVKRRLQRKGAERRRRAKREAQLRADHAKATSIEAELEKFKLQSAASRGRSESVASSQPSNKENDPDRASYTPEDRHLSKRPRAARRMISGGLPSPLNPSASQSSDFGASLLYNQGDRSMLPPPPRRREDGFGRSTSTFSESRGSSLNRSTGDIDSIRSTYLPSASRASASPGVHYGEKYDTTRSTYFKMRAMGLDPNSSTLLPEKRVPQSDKKRLRTSDVDSLGIVPRKRAQTLNGGSRSSQSPPPVVFSQAPDGLAVASIEPGATHTSDADDDDDPVIAMARRARAAMQEGSSLFREASRMLSSTPDRSANHQRHHRHQSHSAITNSPAHFETGSPRPYRPAVSRFLNRIPKSDRQKYSDAAAQELAEETAKDEARRKARADKEARDAEEAIEQERLRQSQATSSKPAPNVSSSASTLPAANPPSAFGGAFQKLPQVPVTQAVQTFPTISTPSASFATTSKHAANENEATTNFTSQVTAQQTSSASSFGQTSAPSSLWPAKPNSPSAFPSFGQSSSPASTVLGTFGQSGFAAKDAPKNQNPAPVQQQQSQPQPKVAAAKPKPRPPVSRSANMFAALADEDEDSGSDEVEDDEADDTQVEDEDEASVGFSDEGQEDDEEDDEEEDEDEDADPSKWQGKGGTSVEDAIEL